MINDKNSTPSPLSGQRYISEKLEFMNYLTLLSAREDERYLSNSVAVRTSRHECVILLVGARISPPVQTGSEAHPEVFPGSKAAGAWPYHPPPLVPTLRKQNYNCSPPLGCHGVFWGEIYLCPLSWVLFCQSMVSHIPS